MPRKSGFIQITETFYGGGALWIQMWFVFICRTYLNYVWINNQELELIITGSQAHRHQQMRGSRGPLRGAAWRGHARVSEVLDRNGGVCCYL